jgi:hypothetical protein
MRPDDIDLRYVMARIGYEAMRNDLLLEHGKAYIDLYDAHGSDLPESDRFENRFDGGRFEKNVTVFTRRPETRAQVSEWLRDAA